MYFAIGTYCVSITYLKTICNSIINVLFSVVSTNNFTTRLSNDSTTFQDQLYKFSINDTPIAIQISGQKNVNIGILPTKLIFTFDGLI